MHDEVPTVISVSRVDTGAPVTNLSIKVRYHYDSYGVRWILRAPTDAEALTDGAGQATLRLATWSYPIRVFLGETSRLEIDAKVVREGAQLQSFARGPNGQVLRVSFQPTPAK